MAEGSPHFHYFQYSDIFSHHLNFPRKQITDICGQNKNTRNLNVMKVKKDMIFLLTKWQSAS